MHSVKSLSPSVGARLCQPFWAVSKILSGFGLFLLRRVILCEQKQRNPNVSGYWVCSSEKGFLSSNFLCVIRYCVLCVHALLLPPLFTFPGCLLVMCFLFH